MMTDPVDIEQLADNLILKETKYVRALKQLQIGRIREEIKMYQKIHQVMFDHQQKLAEFDKKRAEIVSGAVEPTEEECKYEFADDSIEVVETDEKGIPDFWLTIFSNLHMFNENVTDNDSAILEFLKNIRYEILSEPQGFKLFFEFSENPHFANTELVKTYYYSDKVDPFEPLTHSQLVIDRTEGCKIQWKSSELNVTEVNGKKVDSFFNFFDPPTMRYADAEPVDQELLSADFDMGETLYSSIIPHAIVYYTGEGIEDEYDEEDLDEEDDYEEDEEEDDDDDQDGKTRQQARRALRRRGQ